MTFIYALTGAEQAQVNTAKKTEEKKEAQNSNNIWDEVITKEGIHVYKSGSTKGMKASAFTTGSIFTLSGISGLTSLFVKNKTAANILSKTGLFGAIAGLASLLIYSILSTKQTKNLNNNLKIITGLEKPEQKQEEKPEEETKAEKSESKEKTEVQTNTDKANKEKENVARLTEEMKKQTQIIENKNNEVNELEKKLTKKSEAVKNAEDAVKKAEEALNKIKEEEKALITEKNQVQEDAKTANSKLKNLGDEYAKAVDASKEAERQRRLAIEREQLQQTQQPKQ